MIANNYIKKIQNKSKLKGMPRVYYFNLDKDTKRKEFMESQFHNYGISYKRISQSCYTKENIQSWAYKFHDPENILKLHSQYEDIFYKYPANLLTHLEFMKIWLKYSNDKYLLVMEDDYDLSLIDYWHFDWNYLIKNLPLDWDAFKLNDDHMYNIRFFIHPVGKTGFTNFGATLFKREFVQKIISLFYSFYGRIKHPKDRSINNWIVDNMDAYNVDTVLCRFGSIYTAPLITTEASFCVNDKNNSSYDVFRPIQRACHQWWRNEKDLFTLDDFFHYDKLNDKDMTIHIDKNQHV